MDIAEDFDRFLAHLTRGWVTRIVTQRRRKLNVDGQIALPAERGTTWRLPRACVWHHAEIDYGLELLIMTKKTHDAAPGIALDAASDLLTRHGGQRFSTILADPPWQFQNRTGKMAPEHKRLARYGTMQLEDIMALPVQGLCEDTAHLYLWVPNALLQEGLRVMAAWGFQYKSNIVWHKIRKDGGPDGRGVGFYFRNVTELVLFGVRGKNARTLAPGRRQVNFLATQKREHSRKPDEFYQIVESCSPGPYFEMFARGRRDGWTVWGDQSEEYFPDWPTYSNHSQTEQADVGQLELIALPAERF